MRAVKKDNPYRSFDSMPAFRESGDRVPMHPDDYTAHRAWVIARGITEYCPEKGI